MLRLFRRRDVRDVDDGPSAGVLWQWQSAAELLRDGSRKAVVRQIQEAVGVPARHFDELYQSLLERFAELVQLLPASESHHHAHAGGLLDHSLDVAQKAVAIRRGHLLPPGAEPEVVARHSDRWTFAVFSAALLHDVGKATLLGQVERFAADGKSLGPWIAWSGPMRQTARYRFRFAAGRRYDDYPLVGPFLARMLLPELAIAWIGSDVELMPVWIAALAGNEERGGAVGDIVAQADRLSVAASLGVEAGALPAAVRKSPLHVRLTWALRELVESTDLPVNRRGAAAWVFGDELFVVVKRGIDAMRERLLREGHTDIPTRNDRIMDELQQHRVCVANGERAVWTVRIRMADFDQELTVLRFPLGGLWPIADRRPPAMTGEVSVVGEGVTVAGLAPAAIEVAPPVLAPASSADADGRTSSAPISDGTAVEAPSEDAADPGEVSAAGEAGAPVPEERGLPPDGTNGDEEVKPVEPEAFVAWLTDGVSAGRLQLNQVNSLLHVVPEGLLVVSPRAFKVYAGEGEGRNWEYVQRRFVRLRWHRVHAQGKSIFEYEVRGERKTSVLKGMVVSDPERRLGIRLRDPNPCLTRLSAL